VGVALPEGLVPGGVTLPVGVVLPEAVVLDGVTLPETPTPLDAPGGVTLPLGVVKPEADGVMPGDVPLPMGVVLPESVLPAGLVRPLALRDSSFSICRIAFSISRMRTCAMQCKVCCENVMARNPFLIFIARTLFMRVVELLQKLSHSRVGSICKVGIRVGY